jgi:glycogen phosphorylase
MGCTEAEALYACWKMRSFRSSMSGMKTGMPLKWLGPIRESMARLTSEFSATRAIREYTENHYLPAASGYRERAAGDSALGQLCSTGSRTSIGIGTRCALVR